MADLCGKSLLRRVWDKCEQAVGAENVVVATDSQKIERHCHEHGMHVIMTSDRCLTGTDRLCEVAHQINKDIFINVQGDEPLINPDDILSVLEASRKNKDIVINAMCPIEYEKDFYNSNIPKVVTSLDSSLLYMSRASIPTGKKYEFRCAMRQVCIYAFPKNILHEFGRKRKKTRLEDIEDIEILRFLELGFPVKMVEVKSTSVAVDTPDDLERARKLIDV